jgi:hypothetical protein
MKDHNHVKKLRKLMAQGKIPIEAGTVSQVDIAHDPWCQLLRKGKRCNCDPDIRLAWSLQGVSHN